MKELKHIPWTDFGGDGPHTIHFAHANGFPAASYRQLAGHLTDGFRVIGMDARPMWPGSAPSELRNWRQLAEDIIRFLEWQNTGPVIGMGHSFGGICTLLAAQLRPDLFKAVVLVEPVVLPRWVYLMSDVLPKAITRHISPVATKALRRKDTWGSRDEMFHYFRGKEFFNRVNDDALRDYVNAVAMDDDNGEVRLAYSKEWEARVFLTVHNPYAALSQLEQPMFALRGEHSDTIRPEVWERWRAGDRHAANRFVEVAGTGHLLPIENPERVANEVRAFILDAKLG